MPVLIMYCTYTRNPVSPGFMSLFLEIGHYKEVIIYYEKPTNVFSELRTLLHLKS